MSRMQSRNRVPFKLPRKWNIHVGPYELVLYYRQYGMYGPPPCRKRKVKMTVWSAQMYPVFE